MAEHAYRALCAQRAQRCLELGFDFEDEVIRAPACVRDGKVVGALMDLLTEIAILVLAAFVGFEVISKVPNTLHTPLMSGTNAIHGIVVLGGLLLIGPAHGFLNDSCW
jgi:NAD/NADP transhydrogenase alpha subunit